MKAILDARTLKFLTKPLFHVTQIIEWMERIDTDSENTVQQRAKREIESEWEKESGLKLKSKMEIGTECTLNDKRDHVKEMFEGEKESKKF